MKSLKEIRGAVEKELVSQFNNIEKRYGLNGQSIIIRKSLREIALRGGKRIRPILFILSYLGYIKKPAKGYITSAIALEIIQSFILIHDDIVDRSDNRRGRPTLHKLKGNDAAMIIGDILFSLGVQAFLAINEKPERKLRALDLLLESAMHTGCGEINELCAGRKIDKRTLYRIYDQKTGHYTFISPLQLGAVLAGAPMAELKKLESCGRCLGRAFQIQDDLEDVSGIKEKVQPYLAGFYKGSVNRRIALRDLREYVQEAGSIIKTLNIPRRTKALIAGLIGEWVPTAPGNS